MPHEMPNQCGNKSRYYGIGPLQRHMAKHSSICMARQQQHGTHYSYCQLSRALDRYMDCMAQRHVTGLLGCTLFSLVVRGAAYLRGILVLVWVSNVCPHVLPSSISSESLSPATLFLYFTTSDPNCRLFWLFQEHSLCYAPMCYVQIHSFYSLHSKL